MSVLLCGVLIVCALFIGLLSGLLLAQRRIEAMQRSPGFKIGMMAGSIFEGMESNAHIQRHFASIGYRIGSYRGLVAGEVGTEKIGPGRYRKRLPDGRTAYADFGKGIFGTSDGTGDPFAAETQIEAESAGQGVHV